jgi:hypothetical protein
LLEDVKELVALAFNEVGENVVDENAAVIKQNRRFSVETIFGHKVSFP